MLRVEHHQPQNYAMTGLLNHLCLMLAIACASMVVAPLAAATPVSVKPASKLEDLRPGQFFWAPEIAPAGPVILIVSLSTQRAYVYRNGIPIGVATVSSGKTGHETPTGVFTILQKDIDHKSNVYSDAPMPFMQRLTWDGIALHAGTLPGYRASHGCVRLPLAFAKALFGITRIGLTVVITDNPLVPEVAPVGPMLDPVADGHDDPGSYRWEPARSPDGPLSILISGRDRRVVIFRNGIEIGVSSIRLDAPVTTTQAYVYQGADREGQHWLRLPMPNQAEPALGELALKDQARGHIPPAFRDFLASALHAGDTMLVTRDSLPSSGTGARTPIIETVDP